ncbi:MAG: LamG domain-containing protein [Myxococcota bacterium]
MGGACRFGNGEDIQVEHNASFELQAFTLAAWAWPNPIAEGLLYTVAAKPHGPLERNSYEIGFNFFGNTEVALMCYGGLDDGICSSTPVTTDQWIHVAMTYDGEFGRLYVNGELREEDPAPAVGISYDGAPLLIGIDLDNGLPAHPMDGLIDDVRFYSRALNAEELSAL